MITSNQEIVGKFLRERFRFQNDDGDVIIGDVYSDGQRLTVKGPADDGELTTGLEYRFYGRPTSYKNKRTGQSESQFAFQSFVLLEPVSREAVIKYLSHYGKGFGIGASRARALHDAFGSEAVAVARTDPQRVSEALKQARLPFSEGQAKTFAEILAEQQAVEAIKLDLITLLVGRGFPKGLGELIVNRWGNRAADIIRRDPYKLLRFGGVGFKKCDSMYLDLGHNPARLKRQALCAWFSLNRSSDGHTWFQESTPAAFLKSNISGTECRLERALGLGLRGKLLERVESDWDGGPINQGGNLRWYAEASKAKNEAAIADGVLKAMEQPHFWPAVDGLNLSEHQREIAGQALQSSVAILGGSPGTGKTWVVSELVKAIADKIGLDNVLVGAPTGKAAVRVTENLEAKGIPLRARTWHSLLMMLERDKKKHFDAKVLIGDEWSMVDADLNAAIMRARAAGAMLLMVGDVNQLPPVGHGAPLRDLISAGVSYGELTEIVRNSGGIVEACAAIRDQRAWTTGDNLSLVDCREFHMDQIYRILQKAKVSGIDPVWDVQIVTAVNEKSRLSRKELNQELQQMLNFSGGGGIRGFREGDKVVNTKNGFFKNAKSGKDQPEEWYVANGELGKVVELVPGQMLVSLDSPARLVQVKFGQDGCTFDLGYALSVHKSQGSDWPWVVVVLDDYPGAKMVCDRSWLYTAISRAKSHCWLVGQRSVADRMCKISKIWHRKTFLKERVLAGKSETMLAGV